ncbi:integral membrane protein [Geosmithia morbida]|uniref:Integral membrane protein n=1 Tax=Geosmithia morbida TaxID=1094350 RepID=A0A9P5D3K9_9HYPO|nr:uncharacterized protein GMORB2_1735 [Geosmithia morbida]KAF4121895.1 integral membrane protein [Geosmithia morbida]
MAVLSAPPDSADKPIATPAVQLSKPQSFITSVIKKLAICLAIVLCAVWYASAHFYRDPGSAFFDSTRAFEYRYSAHRLSEIQPLMTDDDATSHQGNFTKAGVDPAICLVLTSVKRERTQYLETTVASILHGLSEVERENLYINVLIAETDPARHPVWHRDWIRNAVDSMHSYDNVTSQEIDWLTGMIDSKDYQAKGVFDYVYGLQSCYEASDAPYIAMFEDDILMADGWLVRTLLNLQKLPPPAPSAPRGTGSDHPTSSWLFMRLFNQERSTGWEKRYIGGNNEHLIGLGLGIAILSAWQMARSQSRSVRAQIDPITVGIFAFIFVPSMVVLFFQCGKASLLPPSPGVAAEPFGCCSQALVFPREQIPSLARYLSSWGRGQIDLLLRHRALSSKLDTYSMYPVMAQHLGLDSARMTDEAEAQAIWSMAFEDLDPQMLALTHGAMVDKYEEAYMYGF